MDIPRLKATSGAFLCHCLKSTDENENNKKSTVVARNRHFN